MLRDDTSINLPPLLTVGQISGAASQYDLTFENGAGCDNPLIEVVELFPAELGSLKRKLGRAEDGRRYILLRNSAPRPGAARNEYLCSRIAAECKVALPPFTLLKRERETFFGSMHACGRINLRDVVEGHLDKSVIGKQLSATYALDQLLANTDRTQQNLLFLKADDGHVVVEAIDFSEAGFFGEEWHSSSLLRDACDSRLTYDFLFHTFPFSRQTAERVLNHMVQMRAEFMDKCFSEMPSEWGTLSRLDDSWRHWWERFRFMRAEQLFKSLRAQ